MDRFDSTAEDILQRTNEFANGYDESGIQQAAQALATRFPHATEEKLDTVTTASLAFPDEAMPFVYFLVTFDSTEHTWISAITAIRPDAEMMMLYEGFPEDPRVFKSGDFLYDPENHVIGLKPEVDFAFLVGLFHERQHAYHESTPEELIAFKKYKHIDLIVKLIRYTHDPEEFERYMAMVLSSDRYTELGNDPQRIVATKEELDLILEEETRATIETIPNLVQFLDFLKLAPEKRQQLLDLAVEFLSLSLSYYKYIRDTFAGMNLRQVWEKVSREQAEEESKQQ